MNNEINDDDLCHFSYSYNVKAAMEEYAVKSDFFSFGKSAKKNLFTTKVFYCNLCVAKVSLMGGNKFLHISL